MKSLEGRAGAPLVIDERMEGERCLLQLRGELDLSNADQLQERLEIARESGADRVVVDLSGLNFIDSTGMRILLRAEQASREASGVLSFVRAGGQVDRVMKVAGIDGELTFVD